MLKEPGDDDGAVLVSLAGQTDRGRHAQLYIQGKLEGTHPSCGSFESRRQ
jgi:hypothetical protein